MTLWGILVSCLIAQIDRSANGADSFSHAFVLHTMYDVSTNKKLMFRPNHCIKNIYKVYINLVKVSRTSQYWNNRYR